MSVFQQTTEHPYVRLIIYYILFLLEKVVQAKIWGLRWIGFILHFRKIEYIQFKTSWNIETESLMWFINQFQSHF